MGRFYYGCFFVFASLCLCSCKADKKGVAPLAGSQELIAGTWILQQEHQVQYVDGQQGADTTLNATANNRAYVLFNSNGTFRSAGAYVALTPGGPVNATDSTSGAFSITGISLSLSEPIAGLAAGGAPTALNVSSAPVITPVSHSAALSELSSATLQIHTEYIYTYTVNNVSQTYTIDDDYTYARQAGGDGS